MPDLALAIHGGAGTIHRAQMTPALEAEYRSGLETALLTGWELLLRGARALDAVEAATRALEDFPLFNAGRGSVFTHDGRVEMDAAIMDGSTLRAGAVAFVRNIRNPVSLARMVMERTEHALLAGEGANQFAAEMGAASAPDEYFFTEHRWRQLIAAREAGRVVLDNADLPPAEPQEPKAAPLGTVGAVACDARGNLASATSTGGMTNKKFGRVGDSALIGAGTYADRTCAVSCTGHGEFFMLGVTAYDLAARMKYRDQPLHLAAADTLDALTAIGGEGGFIAVDTYGNTALPFNSEGMYRAHIAENTAPIVEIYR